MEEHHRIEWDLDVTLGFASCIPHVLVAADASAAHLSSGKDEFWFQTQMFDYTQGQVANPTMEPHSCLYS